MDLDHQGHPEGVGEVEVEANYSQILFLLYNGGSVILPVGPGVPGLPHSREGILEACNHSHS